MPDSPLPAAADPLAVHRVHATGHRVRLRCVDPVDRATLVDRTNRLAAVAGVERVLGRPSTGSLIVETRVAAGAVLATMEAEGLVTVIRPPKKPPVRQTVQLGFAKADFDLQTRTEGALDLRTTLALLFLALAVIQFSRGQIAGPATTLAAAALGLLDLPGGRR